MPKLSSDDIERAKRVDPAALLRSFGYKVRYEGKSLVLDDRAYRIDRLQDGHFVYCDKMGSEGGDLIQLLQKLKCVSFRQAVTMLLGTSPINSHSLQISNTSQVVRTAISLGIPSKVDINSARCYLESRGITLKTVLYAENSGFLRYEKGAVLFCGYDEQGRLVNVAKRATDPATAIQKTNLRGSNKSYPQILNGDSKSVWIVEGGIDALALRDAALRQGKTPPTVIVSGGSNVCSFITMDYIKEILSNASKVTIALENEKDERTQKMTDTAHEKQAGLISGVTKAMVMFWRPPRDQGKDIADFNLKIIKKDHGCSHWVK